MQNQLRCFNTMQILTEGHLQNSSISTENSQLIKLIPNLKKILNLKKKFQLEKDFFNLKIRFQTTKENSQLQKKILKLNRKFST